jgi:hypothetical protein
MTARTAKRRTSTASSMALVVVDLADAAQAVWQKVAPLVRTLFDSTNANARRTIECLAIHLGALMSVLQNAVLLDDVVASI